MKSVVVVLFLLSQLVNSQNPTKYVNTFIGTGGHGHTYPGATVPYGFVQLSPDTRPDGYNDWDGCGGYHYSDSIIYGFSHTHLSGTGVADYCDILLMPTVGEPQLNNIKNNDTRLGYTSQFSHKNEKASPGYYAVLLEDDNITVELSATARTGMHKYQFPDTGKINIILDLMHRDKLLEGSYIEIISPTKIQGLRRSSSWAKDQWLYFAIEFSAPFNLAQIVDSTNAVKVHGEQFSSKIISGTQLKSYFQFLGDGGKTILVKCALSPVSSANAWKNMQAEIPGWDFDLVKKNAEDIWNKELSKIEVTSFADEKKSLQDPDNKLVIFYSALYHCMLAPNIYEDVDGRYRGRDNTIHTAENFDNYTVFSLWDTHRALHPLLTIIDQKRTNDFINTFLKQYEQGGRLPVWELSGNETECMIGYHAVSVIADAATKGILDYDLNLAYTAMKHSSNMDHFGLKYYKEKGFIESNEEPESVSKTMEYSYDDWCISQVSALIYLQNKNAKNKTELEYYKYRSLYYKNVMDGNYARPRFNGGWYKPFDPAEVNFNYTEANAWQYSTFAPQSNLPTNELFLDSIFTAPSITTGREQSDITGLIGQYAHGNEPSHNIAYLYNYTYSAPWKTQFYLDKILNNFYKNAPDGLIGNEDCGQMSAWYVLSAIGLYPVCPGKSNYDFGLAVFDKVNIRLENGKTFTINTINNSKENIYLDSISFSNNPVKSLQITHPLLMEGGNLNFYKTSDPSKSFNPKNSDIGNYIEPIGAPVISAASISFSDSLKVQISAPQETGYLFYTMDGTRPTTDSKYVVKDTSFYISDTKTIKVMFCAPYEKLEEINCAGITTATFTKLPNNYKLKYVTGYNAQYSAGGQNALIDGMHGGTDFRTGMWQGWQKENMEVVLDLGEIKEINKAGAGFLQDVRSWIWMPAKLEIYTSTDGVKYTLSATIKNSTPSDNYDSKETKNAEVTFDPIKSRYIKFIAYNFGKVPDWHPGKGGDTWIFCDEVWVK